MEDEVNIEKRIPRIVKIEKGEPFMMHIPECCREGWATCEHVPKAQRKVKTNIGL